MYLGGYRVLGACLLAALTCPWIGAAEWETPQITMNKGVCARLQGEAAIKSDDFRGREATVVNWSDQSHAMTWYQVKCLCLNCLGPALLLAV